MKQYLELLQKVYERGEAFYNRENEDLSTYRLFGQTLEFNFNDGFPIITTKEIKYKQIIGELLGFLKGYNTIEQFHSLGCTLWDANAKAWKYGDGNDLGRIYGVQWRSYGKSFDQITNLIESIKVNPTSRRHIVSAWSPLDVQFGNMCLPPCHVMFQCHVNPSLKEISLTMFQRSGDMFLGVPFNITSYALLLTIIGTMTGYTPKKLTITIGDAHIYHSHLNQVSEQLTRSFLSRDNLKINVNELLLTNPELSVPVILDKLIPEDIDITGYDYHPFIPAPMIVTN